MAAMVLGCGAVVSVGCKGADASAGTATSTSASPAAAPATSSATGATSGSVVAVAVDGKGFTPSSASFKKGDKAQLVFTRTSDDTCAKEVVFPELSLKKELPLNKPVAIEVPTDAARTLTFQCGMGMYKSKVLIQ